MVKVSIAQYLGDSSIVKDVHRYSDDVLCFYCGGTGLVSSSTYSGFYYSENDMPYGLEFDGYPLTETSEGVYEWSEYRKESGLRKIVTERICENWFTIT